MPESKTIIFDGDGIAWKCAFFSGHDPRHAINSILKIADELGGGRIILTFSDPSRRYFRHDLFPAYKHKSSPAPAGLDDVKAGMSQAFITRTLPRMEADDVCGILATHDSIRGTKFVVSSDHDLRTVPGFHYNPNAKAASVVSVSEEEADYNHMLQTLVGDTGDCYGGCPQVGEKKAPDLLRPAHMNRAAMWRIVVKAFAAKNLPIEYAITQSRLARICRAQDWDGNQVIPWMPPQLAEAA